MSDNVSSNVLFHFTKSMANLKSILKYGFFPHYCPEYTLDAVDLEAAKKRRSPMRAIALVSFCDLPLSLIKKHLEEYGEFGIGLTKEWGRRNGVTPVIYTHAKAQTRKPLVRLAAAAEKRGSEETKKDLMVVAAYTKPFAGPAWRSNKVQRKVLFYDEREWRHLASTGASEPLFLDQRDYSNSSKLARLHARLKKTQALKVYPDDVQYLIVPHDDNILELVGCLKGLYGKRDTILVTTAIMTINCITEDA